MRRKLFNFFISSALIISLLSLTSCNKYNKVIQYEDTDDIKYNNIKYIRTEQGKWSCDYEKLSEIGWTWYIPPIAVSAFYSDNTDSTDFIYCSRGGSVWLRDGYDYEQETFEIDNTDIKTVFADAFSDESVEYFDFSAEKTASFAWHPAAHPELKSYPDIFEKNGSYYIRFVYGEDEEAYLIKDSFLKTLRDNNILPAQKDPSER